MQDIININFNIFNKDKRFFMQDGMMGSLLISKLSECLGTRPSYLIELNVADGFITLYYEYYGFLKDDPLTALKANPEVKEIEYTDAGYRAAILKVYISERLMHYLADDRIVSTNIYKSMLIMKLFLRKTNVEFMCTIEAMHINGTFHDVDQLLNKPSIKKEINKHIKGFTLDTLDDILALEGYLLTCNTV